MGMKFDFSKQIMRFVSLVALPFILLAFTLPVLAQNGELPPEFPKELAVILGVLAPLVIQFINKNVASDIARLGIAIALSIVIAIVAAMINGLPFELSIPFIVAVFSLGQAAFNVFWKPIVFNRVLKAPK